MQQHTDALRTLLSSGLRRDDALVRLRDSGVSAIACVKALTELHTIAAAEAKGLVGWLNSIPTPTEAAEQARLRAEAHPDESIAAAFATLGDPPVRVETIENQGSWFSIVTARDGNVVWRFVWERSVWTVDAAPIWEPDESFDPDMLARHFLGRSLSPADASLEERMRFTAADIVRDVGIVRRAVLDGFRQETWAELRGQLRQLRQQRHFEAWGVWTPSEGV